MSQTAAVDCGFNRPTLAARGQERTLAVDEFCMVKNVDITPFTQNPARPPITPL